MLARLSLVFGGVALIVVATFLACGGDGPACKMDSECASGMCKDGHCTTPPVLDLAQYFGPDMAKPAAGKPTCVPPGTVMCGAGETFYSSPTVSGCFPTGMKPANANPDPGYDNPMGACPNTDNVIACDTPPSCSFCLSKAAAIPTGCYAM
jgi:hypothetical protein